MGGNVFSGTRFGAILQSVGRVFEAAIGGLNRGALLSRGENRSGSWELREADGVQRYFVNGRLVQIGWPGRMYDVDSLQAKAWFGKGVRPEDRAAVLVNMDLSGGGNGERVTVHEIWDDPRTGLSVRTSVKSAALPGLEQA